MKATRKDELKRNGALPAPYRKPPTSDLSVADVVNRPWLVYKQTDEN